MEAEDLHQRIESLEMEKSFLSQEVKDLKNALNKQKVFHRKFADDVMEAEEMRIKDFNNEVKGLQEENKRLRADNRELAKEKSFYQAAYNSIADEDDNDSTVRSNNVNLSTSGPIRHPYSTRSSSTVSHPTTSQSSQSSINEDAIHPPSNIRNKKTNNLKKVSKLSEKWFADCKKMKLKVTKLSSDNTRLKLTVKKLENFKNKIQNKKITQEAQKIELQSLSKATVRTNEQIFFNAGAMAKLSKFSKE